MLRKALLVGSFVCFGLAFLGCDSGHDPGSVGTLNTAVQVTGDLSFFCDWQSEADAFQTAQADYAQGNRRSADAWQVLNSKDVPGGTPQEQSICWQGALLYLGVFGERTELVRLIQLSKKDPVLGGETTNPGQTTGVSDFGEFRSVALSSVYLALAAQVRRQLIFQGTLDSQAQAARSIVQDCAVDHMKCISQTDMHIYRRQRLQRHAVRGLVVSGTPSDLAVYAGIRSSVASQHFLMPHALAEADKLKRRIDDNLALFQSAVPAP